MLRFRKNIFSFRNIDVSKYTIELNNIVEFKRLFGWKNDPIYLPEFNYEYKYVEEANQRKLRDAEIIATVMVNIKPKVALEIGTGRGNITVLMAKNSPESKIYTINALNEELRGSKGGKLTTMELTKDEIGEEYKKLKLSNIIQIYENTAKWEPDIEDIQFAFIDGCHDEYFVYNDTLKVLKIMKKNGIILWHDFNPSLRDKFHWIDSVCRGIERLYKNNYLTDRIYLLRDSWVGLYFVN